MTLGLIAGFIVVAGVVGCTSSSADVATPQASTASQDPGVTQADVLNGADGLTAENFLCDSDSVPAREVHLTLFLEPTAAQADIDSITAELAQSKLVASFEFTDQQQAKQDFDANFSDTAIADTLEMDELPTSFAVSVADPIDDNVARLIDRYDDDPLIFEASETSPYCLPEGLEDDDLCEAFDLPTEAVVILDLGAPPAEADRIQALLEESGIFDSIVAIDQAQALEQLRQRIDDVDALDVGVEDMPLSFELSLPPGADFDALQSQLEADPTVLAVVNPGSCDLPFD